MRRNATLQELLYRELEKRGEGKEDLITVVVGDFVGRGATEGEVVEYEELAEYEGDVGYGGENLPRLHAWTEQRVYFKSVYDGAESVKSVPRNPTDDVPQSL